MTPSPGTIIIPLMDNIIFENRERAFAHASFEQEFAFYKAVQDGDREKVEKLMSPLGSDSMGSLSKNRLQSLKYHFAITIAELSRYAIEGGMDLETSYSLSDSYISRCDELKNEKDIHSLHKKAVFDYTDRMKKTVLKKLAPSGPVKKTINYIFVHLHEKLCEDSIAEAVGLSRSYLSRLFKKETGISLSGYIRKKKIEEACNMLRFSEKPVSEIASDLAFSSHSYFIKVFKATTGMTPGEFRAS